MRDFVNHRDHRDHAGDAGDAGGAGDVSREQIAWQEIAVTIRNCLGTAAHRLNVATPAEAKAFLEACRDAYWLEVNARSYDANVAIESDKKPWD